MTTENHDENIALNLWAKVVLSSPNSSADSTFHGTEEQNQQSFQQEEGTSFAKKELYPVLDHYETSQEIARGGMGVIYQGFQKNLYRDVALKKIRFSTSFSKRKQERFIAEAVITAFLDHPNIVPVYDLGKEANGEMVISMKLVRGLTWKALLRPKTETEREKAKKYSLKHHLEILITVCNAIAFAHSKNIVHNDLKPENIIIGEFGAILVMDWGIAVDIQDNPPRDLPVQKKKAVRKPMGTPNYLAPELALGKGFSIGPWTDVYLLGAILYELMTQKPPHKAATIEESLAIAIENKIPPLPTDLPEELVEICLRALSKNPKKRHGSVLEFQKAIQDFLEHRESLLITVESRKIMQHAEQQTKSTLSEGVLDRNRVYEDFNQAISGFRQALLLWDGNTLARKLEQEAHLEYAKISFQNDDLGLAEAQTRELDKSFPERQVLLEKIEGAKQKKIRSQKMLKHLRNSLISALILILCGLIGFIFWIKNEQKQTALQYASLYTKSLSEFRALYSSKIVSRVKNQGIVVSHDYKNDNEVPFPATFSIELSKKISEGKDGLKARLYSDYPFPWRREEGGVKDEFEQEALTRVRANPEKPYVRFETVEGIPSMRFAKAVPLEESCVGCHNTHPESPKKDWKTGDVRGVQAIILPLGSTTEKFKEVVSEMVSGWVIVLFVFLATLGIFGVYLKKNPAVFFKGVKRKNRS